MPYKSTKEISDNVRKILPKHAEDIYKEAYNSAWKQYDLPKEREGGRSREETAHAVAWSAVKKVYVKDKKTGKWVKKKD
jgi:cation transport regulator